MAKNLLNLVHSELAQGVVMTMQDNSVIMNVLPFVKTNGAMTYLYNVVDEYNNAEFRNINEPAVGGYSEPAQRVETLKILASDVLTDRIFLTGGIGNINDVKAENTAIAIKSMTNKIESQFFYGTGEGKDFKGLKTRLVEGIGKEFKSVLDMDVIDECVDFVSYGVGTKVIVCNHKTRRALNKLMRASGLQFANVEMFGQSVTNYDGAIIYPTDAVADNEIFFMNLEESIGVAGLTSNGLYAEDMGFENNFHRTAVEMLLTIKTPHPNCFALLTITEPATK